MKTAYRRWVSIKLRKLRNDAGLTQLQVAELLGVAHKTYQSYEEERAEPSIYLIKNLCTFYTISVDEFLKDSPNNS